MRIYDKYPKRSDKYTTTNPRNFATGNNTKRIAMDFYRVLEKRRTVRDFSDEKVTDEMLEKILAAAFKAPTNDHLRQFEFVVVRGRERIARLVSPVAENTCRIQQTGLEAAAETMDKDKHAMFVDALPKQQRARAERVSRAADIPAEGVPVMPSGEPKFAQLFRFGMGRRGKYPAGSDGRRIGLRVPHPRRQRIRARETHRRSSGRL